MNSVWKKACSKRKKSSERSIRKACLILLTVLSMLVLCAFDMEDGEYSVYVDITGGSGKASVTSPTLLTIEDKTPVARIQ